MNNEFYTVLQVSLILQVSERSVLNSIKKGRIIAFRPTSGVKAPWRISRVELDRIQVMDLDATVTNLLSMKKD